MRGKLLLLSLVGICLMVPAAFGGGPLVIYDPATRTPMAYPPGPVSVFTDLGGNGVLSNDESDSLVHKAFAEWNGVSTSYFNGVIAGEILIGGVPTDIVSTNADSILGDPLGFYPPHYNGGGIFVVYDSTGLILSSYIGAPPGVAGLASPEWANADTLLESFVIINGSLIDPGDTSPFPGATYMGVYTHEIGHAINLAHTQTNGAMIFPPGDNLGASGCTALTGTPSFSDTETMYPFIDITPMSTGLYQATLHQDDRVALSNVYPTGGWPASHGSITGTIFMPDGTTEVTGVNVIARNLANPLDDAVSAISGDYTQGDLGADGLFNLNGLDPGAEYVVYVDRFDDGSPFSVPVSSLPFFEEYWNGAGESGNLETDTTCSYVSIPAAAGSPFTADILLNVDPDVLPLTNVDPIQVALPFSFPFCGSVYDSVWVDPDGFLSFGAPDFLTSVDAAALLAGPPRITGVWTDLVPESGGTVTAKEVGGNFVVTYTSVPEIFLAIENTFSITLRPDGSHRVDFGVVDAFISMVGRSPGGGAVDPGGTDLSLAPQPFGAETVYEAFFLVNLDFSNTALEFDPCGSVLGVEPGLSPDAAALLQNHPNPFRASTVISFNIPRPGPVTLRVFDIKGRLVNTLLDETLDAGPHDISWNGHDATGSPAAPGIYFYRLESDAVKANRKALLLQR